MRSAILLFTYFIFMGAGFSAPFLVTLGYVWVDMFSPQWVGYSIVDRIPMSLIAGVGAVGAYLMLDRRHPPRPVLGLWLIGIFATWITLTTIWATFPDAAWDKWNWAFKTVAFSAFLPFVVRSRVQIEAMLLTIVFSVGGTLVASGIKTLVTGGGYGLNLGLLSGNAGLAEGSTIADVAIALIPLILYARRHAVILPRHWLTDLLCYGLVFAAALTALGTYARTGLVAFGTLVLLLWLQSRRKIRSLAIWGAMALVGSAFMPDAWSARMSTISGYGSEASALTRIGVWEWTLNYVSTHPLGGGFGIYLLDTISVPIKGSDATVDDASRAFHSIYFEVLGEQGIVGLAIFAAIVACMFLYLFKVSRTTSADAPDAWLHHLSWALITSAAVYLAGGAFVGIGFQPYLYYLVAGSISLHQYVARAGRTAQDGPAWNAAPGASGRPRMRLPKRLRTGFQS